MSAQLEHYRKLHDLVSELVEDCTLNPDNMMLDDHAELVRLLTTVPQDDSSEARDAARYRYLREQPIDSIERGGIFVGLTPQNIVANGADLDARMDAAMGVQATPKAWTVLLLLPDYFANDFGTETYLAHVEADSAEWAVTLAQIEAARPHGDAIDEPSDFHVLLVIEGKHMDVTP